VTVADLYLTIVVVGLCAVSGAIVYKYHRDLEERIDAIEGNVGRVYHALPTHSDVMTREELNDFLQRKVVNKA